MRFRLNENTESKIISLTLAFTVCFHLSHTKRFRMKTHTFGAFSPILHTKTTENADENGGFWISKTHRLGENQGFWKRYREKRHILSFPSAFSAVLVWTIGENASKSMRFRMKTN